MPIALVQFRLKAPVTPDEARAMFEATAGRYLDYPGLERKSYFRADDGMLLGAIYEWKTREAGETLYDEAWRARVKVHYGAEPDLVWLETPVIVDNGNHKIRRT